VEDRIGVNNVVGGSPSAEIVEFRNFMEELELADLPLVGRTFTCYHASGRAMSRVDRIFISDEWAVRWG
jgi:hypothetical protein